MYTDLSPIIQYSYTNATNTINNNRNSKESLYGFSKDASLQDMNTEVDVEYGTIYPEYTETVMNSSHSPDPQRTGDFIPFKDPSISFSTVYTLLIHNKIQSHIQHNIYKGKCYIYVGCVLNILWLVVLIYSRNNLTYNI